ncbi:MAG: DUF4198 domain-containing protein, partial [Deltaproteobacteria bacterium]|nr:DUF4198 domain-containing protein [Deltaproteobacteria bacterium]
IRPVRQRAAGRVAATDAGVHTLVFQSRHSYIELPAKKFEHYLVEEGLEHIVRLRRRMGKTGRPGRESYFRNCKSLLRVGSSTQGFDRRVGLPFEITALTNPFRGGMVELVVERHGRPAAGVKVDLIALDGLRVAAEAVSDQRGRIRVRIPRGSWMLAATDMRRAPRGVRGDWESAWTSLTFESTR